MTATDNQETQERLDADSVSAHGTLGASQGWKKAIRVTNCSVEARPGYQSKLAHEYLDTPEVLKQKVKLLADLVTRSKRMCLYTGAGISTAAGKRPRAPRWHSMGPSLAIDCRDPGLCYEGRQQLVGSS